MKIPKKLKVAGIVYEVKQKRLINEKYSGQALHRQAVIEIATHDFDGKPYSPQKMEECFLHEVLHCVDDIYNNQSLEEKMVDRLSNGLYQVFKDNRLLDLKG